MRRIVESTIETHCKEPKMKKETSIANLTDRTPKYTVKQMAEKMGLTTYAVRYYDNAGLIPEEEYSKETGSPQVIKRK